MIHNDYGTTLKIYYEWRIRMLNEISFEKSTIELEENINGRKIMITSTELPEIDQKDLKIPKTKIYLVHMVLPATYLKNTDYFDEGTSSDAETTVWLTLDLPLKYAKKNIGNWSYQYSRINSSSKKVYNRFRLSKSHIKRLENEISFIEEYVKGLRYDFDLNF